MLHLKDKINVRVAKTTWKGRFRWRVYLDGIGFYHMQMDLSAGALIDLKRHLRLWIK